MSEDAVSIYVVRHGATTWSNAGRHTGRTDIALDASGRDEAVRLSVGLAGLTVANVYTSPLRRARETCELAGFGDRAVVLDALMEWDYGDYEGLTTLEIRASRPSWDLFSDGCPNGEDVEAVARRAEEVLGTIDPRPGTNGATLVFSHGHLLRVLVARYLGLPAVDGACFALDAGHLGALGYERERRVLYGWNAPAVSWSR